MAMHQLVARVRNAIITAKSPKGPTAPELLIVYTCARIVSKPNIIPTEWQLKTYNTSIICYMWTPATDGPPLYFAQTHTHTSDTCDEFIALNKYAGQRV